MLENLINLVREHAGDAIINNPAIPNERNEDAVTEAGKSIAGGLQNVLSNGGLQDVLKLFGGQGGNMSSNPVVQNVSGSFVQDLMDKFGVDRSAANGIAGNLIPTVLQKLVHKTNDPSDNSFDLQGIFNHLSSGSTQGVNIQSLLSKVTSGALDKDGDGDVDLKDLAAMFSNNNQAGGLMDKVKGLFGN